jgi:hypothetical protein
MSGSPSQFQISQVEAALISLLKTVMPAAYQTAIGAAALPVLNIDSLGEKDFDAEGQLVLKPPSIRVRFDRVKRETLRDNQRLTYQTKAGFDVLCYESSLRSKADERLQTLQLVQVVENQLAGARLALADGTSSMPCALGSTYLVAESSGSVDQLFCVEVVAEGIQQYDGPNARFGS